jgi:hypothetical protein
MPRAASRILLKITDLRIERLAEISHADACAEGFDPPLKKADARAWFKALWDGFSADPMLQWAYNPWVWAITFRVVRRRRLRP